MASEVRIHSKTIGSAGKAAQARLAREQADVYHDRIDVTVSELLNAGAKLDQQRNLWVFPDGSLARPVR